MDSTCRQVDAGQPEWTLTLGACLLPTAVGKTCGAARAMLRPSLAFYDRFFPRYEKLMAEHGFVTEVAAIAGAWPQGDRQSAERAVSDAMIDATSIAGTPEDCRARLEAYRQWASMCRLSARSPAAHGTAMSCWPGIGVRRQRGMPLPCPHARTAWL